MGLNSGIKQWLKGLFGDHNDSTNDVDDQVNRMYRMPLAVFGPADAGATDDVADSYFYEANEDCKVISAGILYSGTDEAAHTDNYVTFNLKKADGTGGTAAVIATANTSATALENGELFALTVSTADIDAGEVLALGVSKAGTGIDLGTYALVVELEGT